MTFNEFKISVSRHFPGATNYRNRTNKGPGVKHPVYSADVVVDGTTTEVRVSNPPNSKVWNAWPEPPQGVEKRVAGASGGDAAQRRLAAVL